MITLNPYSKIVFFFFFFFLPSHLAPTTVLIYVKAALVHAMLVVCWDID
jgi:hypothetical protein